MFLFPFATIILHTYVLSLLLAKKTFLAEEPDIVCPDGISCLAQIADAKIL